MRWLIYAFAASFVMASADSLIKFSSGKLTNSLGVLLYGGCAFLTGICWVLWDHFHGVNMYAQLPGIIGGIGVGVAFSLTTLFLYLTFAAGAPISIASPLVRVGGLLLAVLYGLIVLNEPLTWRYVVGMVLTLSGLYLIVIR